LATEYHLASSSLRPTDARRIEARSPGEGAMFASTARDRLVRARPCCTCSSGVFLGGLSAVSGEVSGMTLLYHTVGPCACTTAAAPGPDL